MAKKTFNEEYESIGAFLVLELLALVGFGLGGVSIIYQYAGFIVALIATFFAFKNYSKEDSGKVINQQKINEILYDGPAIWAGLYKKEYLKKEKIFFL